MCGQHWMRTSWSQCKMIPFGQSSGSWVSGASPLEKFLNPPLSVEKAFINCLLNRKDLPTFAAMTLLRAIKAWNVAVQKEIDCFDSRWSTWWCDTLKWLSFVVSRWFTEWVILLQDALRHKKKNQKNRKTKKCPHISEKKTCVFIFQHNSNEAADLDSKSRKRIKTRPPGNLQIGKWLWKWNFLLCWNMLPFQRKLEDSASTEMRSTWRLCFCRYPSGRQQSKESQKQKALQTWKQRWSEHAVRIAIALVWLWVQSNCFALKHLMRCSDFFRLR